MMGPETVGVQCDAAPPIFFEVPLEHNAVVLSFLFLPAHGISAVNKVNLHPCKADLKACVHPETAVPWPEQAHDARDISPFPTPTESAVH